MTPQASWNEPIRFSRAIPPSEVPARIPGYSLRVSPKPHATFVCVTAHNEPPTFVQQQHELLRLPPRDVCTRENHQYASDGPAPPSFRYKDRQVLRGRGETSLRVSSRDPRLFTTPRSPSWLARHSRRSCSACTCTSTALTYCIADPYAVSSPLVASSSVCVPAPSRTCSPTDC